ncbi:hypothetical protein Bhyg_14227, partial [Pseudolycoriella hygida]
PYILTRSTKILKSLRRKIDHLAFYWFYMLYMMYRINSKFNGTYYL